MAAAVKNAGLVREARLSETLHQIARRVTREQFSPSARGFINAARDRLDQALIPIIMAEGAMARMPAGHSRQADFEDVRWQIIDAGDVPTGEKGALLALLGSMERAEGLIDRIAEERASVDRSLAFPGAEPRESRQRDRGAAGLMPAE